MAQRCSERAGWLSFSGAASVLPAEVLAEVRQAIGMWQGSGTSVLELPFAGADFIAIQREAEATLREMLAVPAHYHVLFLQGGATAQFRLVPLNLLGARDCAAYVETGHWSGRAIAEAAQVCRPAIAARARNRIPPADTWRIPPGAAYCHITGNETADGVQFHHIPSWADVPLVADLTADLLTGPLDVERFGLIYASAQKNLGIPGLTVVIVRADLLGTARAEVPAPFDYARQVAAQSRINTPPVFPIFVADRVLQWLKRHGGLVAAAVRCQRRSESVYAAIDASDFYRCPARPTDRSRISICFRLPSTTLEAAFLKAAEQQGLLHLQGHPSVGGIRACLYNAMPEAGADRLAAFMAEFADAHRDRH